MVFITLFFACLGFLSPANRGSLGSTAIVLFIFLGLPAGYVSARVYKTFGGERWKCKLIVNLFLQIINLIFYFSKYVDDIVFDHWDVFCHFLYYEFDFMGRRIQRR